MLYGRHIIIITVEQIVLAILIIDIVLPSVRVLHLTAMKTIRFIIIIIFFSNSMALCTNRVRAMVIQMFDHMFDLVNCARKNSVALQIPDTLITIEDTFAANRLGFAIVFLSGKSVFHCQSFVLSKVRRSKGLPTLGSHFKLKRMKTNPIVLRDGLAHGLIYCIQHPSGSVS